MEIVSPAIEEYLKEISPREDPIIEEMEDRAKREGFPIVGPLVGRILYQLVKISGARRVLELGSGFGYSAYWFGLALEERSDLILTEYSDQNLQLAQRYFERGHVRARVRFLQGEALHLIENLGAPFDIIFNDVDKYQYPEVFQKVTPLLGSGGLLISDNVLWHGRVLERNPDRNTKGILEYTRLIFESPSYFSSIIPVRDGISVSVKR